MPALHVGRVSQKNPAGHNVNIRERLRLGRRCRNHQGRVKTFLLVQQHVLKAERYAQGSFLRISLSISFWYIR